MPPSKKPSSSRDAAPSVVAHASLPASQTQHEGAQGERASDTVFFGIVRGLEAQTLVPGQRLVESDLAMQYGLGRNTVREALQRLEAEGIVELLRHKGAAIRALTLQETLDVLDVAERMTGLLARTATRQSADKELRFAVKTALQDLEQADASQDLSAFSAARRRFYRALLSMGNNSELQRLFPAIHMPIVYAQYRLPGLQKLRLADYHNIAKAVLAGNADEADAHASDHVRKVRAAILSHQAAPGAQLA
jgi:DNA-binding GntR family transcriptional regulator